jgi:hypothetical protein
VSGQAEEADPTGTHPHDEQRAQAWQADFGRLSSVALNLPAVFPGGEGEADVAIGRSARDLEGSGELWE